MKPEYEPKTLLAALGKLSEECAEVIKEVGKIQRFGLHGKNPETDPATTPDNEELLRMEMNQVYDAIKIVCKILDHQKSLPARVVVVPYTETDYRVEVHAAGLILAPHHTREFMYESEAQQVRDQLAKELCLP